jgi:hypothetical protein
VYIQLVMSVLDRPVPTPATVIVPDRVQPSWMVGASVIV